MGEDKLLSKELLSKELRYLCPSCDELFYITDNLPLFCPVCGLPVRLTNVDEAPVAHITTEKFDQIVDKMLKHCLSTLNAKAKEYATDDRLHNFKRAAELQRCTPKRALEGMMAKHIISLFDMAGSNETFPIALWDEKLGDTINYCLLMRALVEEDTMQSAIFYADKKAVDQL